MAGVGIVENSGNNKSGKLISILSIITPVIVLLLGFGLIYRFEVQNLKSDSALKSIQTEIAKIDLENKKIKKDLDDKISKIKIEDIGTLKDIHELQKSILQLDLNIKEYKDSLEISNNITINYLNSLEASVKKIRDKLDIKSKRLGITSETLQIINDLVPKMILHIDKDKFLFEYEKRKITLPFVLLNKGKYGCTLKKPTITITEGIISKPGEFEKIRELVTPKDYTIATELKLGYYPPGETHPYIVVIKLNNWVNNIWPNKEKLKVKIVYDYQTHKPVVDSVKEHLKGVISSEKLSDLIKETGSFTVDLGFIK